MLEELLSYNSASHHLHLKSGGDEIAYSSHLDDIHISGPDNKYRLLYFKISGEIKYSYKCGAFGPSEML